MLRRRNVAPPYEVMRTTPPRAGTPASGTPGAKPSSTPEPSVVHRAPTPSPAGEIPPNAWGRFNTPMVLRLPRGLIALLALAILVVVGLAYWVGRSMGAKDEAEQKQRDIAIEKGEVDRFRPTMPGENSSQNNTGIAPNQATGQEPTQGAPPDPSGVRRVGLNYLVLANYSRAEDAKRLADYLQKSGVAVEIVRVKMSGPFQVVAMRGFAGNELRTAGEAFRRDMQKLGRTWKREFKGDTDFEHAYFDKYEGS